MKGWSFMNFFVNIFKGIFIGAGAILPGISSGVFCVIFGIYEDLVNRVLHFFKDFKNNVIFFLPLTIGAGISIIFISKGLLYLLENYTIQTSYCFIGLILGCIPSVFKYANNSTKNEISNRNNAKSNRRNRHNTSTKSSTFLKYLSLIFTFCFSIYLIALEYNANLIGNQSVQFSFLDLIKNGALMSAGVVIPGISNTVILMLLGTYNTYLGALSSIDLGILIPMGIGLVIGGFIFLKVIEFLFSRFKIYTYYGVIGFTLGSIFVLFPGFEANVTTLISVLIMIFSFFVSYKLSSIEKVVN